MTPRRVFPPVVLLACVALGWQMGGADRIEPSSGAAAEAVRLRAHFAQVERELLARDVSMLSPEQRHARAEQIERLRAYAAAGNFPRNDYHPGQQVPYFRDAQGNLCAMAFLIAASGRGDIVDHIARNRNNAYIPDLVDEPGLAGWLEDNGLSLAEAARIQPSYSNPCHTPLCEEANDRTPGKGYVRATIGAGWLSGISMGLNLRSAENRSAAAGLFGVGIGAVTMTMGALKVGDEGWKNQTIGAWNIAVGATAAFLGGRALTRRRETAIRTADRLRIVPTTMTGARPALGFVGSLRF